MTRVNTHFCGVPTCGERKETLFRFPKERNRLRTHVPLIRFVSEIVFVFLILQELTGLDNISGIKLRVIKVSNMKKTAYLCHTSSL